MTSLIFWALLLLKPPRGIFLSQQKYAIELLAKAGMSNCKPSKTPLPIKPIASPTDHLPFSHLSHYRTFVGGLQYLTITRPDIAFAENQACQHMHAPTNAHFASVKCLVLFIQGTLHYGLTFSPGSFELHAFSDSDWAGDASDRRSTTGFCIFWGNNLVSWAAKKQPTVSRSSSEAEYRALAQTTTEFT